MGEVGGLSNLPNNDSGLFSLGSMNLSRLGRLWVVGLLRANAIDTTGQRAYGRAGWADSKVSFRSSRFLQPAATEPGRGRRFPQTGPYSTQPPVPPFITTAPVDTVPSSLLILVANLDLKSCLTATRLAPSVHLDPILSIYPQRQSRPHHVPSTRPGFERQRHLRGNGSRGPRHCCP